ncbi:hypothetical protein CALCODRAFT_537825 [Calocera cornea HHB12733]|uniref:TPR-like protein n=1 Tax=Calocera cornea HHB12733 TaxID=1353952 RepID=A0A165C2V5_9BASI|nr:hypothetical protein CALCODRAFT_537825 [Calocera cornea HHB12733]
MLAEQYDQAVTCLCEATTVFGDVEEPSGVELFIGTCFYFLGICEYERRQYTAAQDYLQRGLEHPTFANQGLVVYYSGILSELDQLLLVGKPDFDYYLGRVSICLFKFQEAHEHFQSAANGFRFQLGNASGKLDPEYLQSRVDDCEESIKSATLLLKRVPQQHTLM